MYFEKHYHGLDIRIIVRRQTEERLSTTCFRGKEVALAGNFFRWGSIREFLNESLIRFELFSDISESWRAKSFGTQSLSLAYTSLAGWESTDQRSKYHADWLEEFQPNRRSKALRVRPDYKDIPAPQTNLVTIVYELKEESEIAVAVIHSIYPGEDIGELNGNVTERENRIFFDWSHPGA